MVPKVAHQFFRGGIRGSFLTKCAWEGSYRRKCVGGAVLPSDRNRRYIVSVACASSVLFVCTSADALVRAIGTRRSGDRV